MKSRCIFDVIDEIVKVIPKETSDSKPLLDSINKFLDNSIFIPPEILYDANYFFRFSEILIMHFGKTPPKEGWQKDVYDIWMDKK